jgi:hypothetical protein
MDDRLAAQRDAAQRRLHALAVEGRALRDHFRHTSLDRLGEERLETWQRACASLVGQLAGGRKSHWLSRAFSDAFLLSPVASAHPTLTAPPADIPPEVIVDRILGVIEQADASLAGMGVAAGPAAGGGSQARQTRYDFVNSRELRATLETADLEAQAAFERGDFATALVSWCSALEAIITHALEGPRATSTPSGSIEALASWSFDRRIEYAQQARLISAGCARLPPIARRYRDALDPVTGAPAVGVVSAAEAQTVRQVLNVIRGDLAGGR